MIRLLIGGSPCTKWSIAQTKGRETQPNCGIGWELFLNYKIAIDKFKPDYFLYENNKSAATPIKDEIARQLEVVEPDLLTPDNGRRMTYINSALVSAQNRQRFYVTNFGDIEQPKDMGILLRDILETGHPRYEKSPCIDANYYKGGNLTRPNCQSGQRLMSFEPIRIPEYGNVGKARPINSHYSNNCGGFEHRMFNPNPNKQQVDMIAYPINTTGDGKSQTIKGQYQKTSAANICCYSSTYGASGVEESVGYATPCEWDENGRPTKAISGTDGKVYTVYEVKNGLITIKGKQYPIKLPDGFYIIRKLTVNECKRLQTIPDWYEFPVSDSQAYKMIGNGWTIKVITHILSHIPNIQNEEIEVLSMYDGMSCGQIALKEMACNVVRYYATEIDKYAIQTTQHNFPSTIQLGDAFQVRENGWRL